MLESFKLVLWRVGSCLGERFLVCSATFLHTSSCWAVCSRLTIGNVVWSIWLLCATSKIGLTPGKIVKVLVLLSCERVQTLSLLHVGVGLILLLPLRIAQLLLKALQLVFQGVELLLFSILLGLVPHLLFDLLEFFGLFGEGKLLLVVNLLLESYHVFLHLLKLRPVLISGFIGSLDLGLHFHNLDLFLGKFISQHIEWALFDLHLVGIEFGICLFECRFKGGELGVCALFVSFQLSFFFLEFPLYVKHLFLLVSKLAAYFSNFVFEFFFELYDSLFSTLKIQSLLSHLGFKTLHRF